MAESHPAKTMNPTRPPPNSAVSAAANLSDLQHYNDYAISSYKQSLRTVEIISSSSRRFV